MSDNSIETPQVDVRGPRFAAWVTTGVLIAALLVSAASPIAAAVILGVQAVVFAIGAIGGPRKHPYGRIFATLVAPRLGPPAEREPIPPLQFAQGLGFGVRIFAGEKFPAPFEQTHRLPGPRQARGGDRPAVSGPDDHHAVV